MFSAKKTIQSILSEAGISVNGPEPHDIQVHNERFYTRVLSQGSLGLGESYMDGWWDCPALDAFFTKLLSQPLPIIVTQPWPVLIGGILSRLTNLPLACPYHIGKIHYDLGNEFYRAMLDKTMSYSCAVWKGADSLETAQTNKLTRICQKLALHKGQTLLDIGCGWGGLARLAAHKYGNTVTGITVSHQQAKLAREVCLDLSVDIRYEDYHSLRGVFNNIASIGMFEHVGYKNYRDFFKAVSRLLADNGLFLLQTIGSLKTKKGYDPWLNRYIFPNAHLPSLAQISLAAEGSLVAEDIENIGADYDTTLMAWHRNFEAHWPRFTSSYGLHFYRMWRYYLLMSAGIFRSRHAQVWQIVFSKQGVRGGYHSLR